MLGAKAKVDAISGSGDRRLAFTLSSVPSTMAKTDPEANASEHTSENEDVEQVQSEGDSSKVTLEQRQQKLAQLRSRMVRQATLSLTSDLAYK